MGEGLSMYEAQYTAEKEIDGLIGWVRTSAFRWMYDGQSVTIEAE